MLLMILLLLIFFFFFFNDTATTEIYTLSLHDALPILSKGTSSLRRAFCSASRNRPESTIPAELLTICQSTSSTLDRKSTRLNSSHGYISYAVFCLKKKKITSNAYLALATQSK